MANPYFLLSFFCYFFNQFSITSLSQETDAEVELLRLQKKLNNISSISYDYHLILNYPSEGYISDITYTCYFEFNQLDKLLGFKYQVDNEQFKMVYNGKEQFSLNKETKKMKLNNNPKLNDFTSTTFFFNSIVTLKKSLQEIIDDSNIMKSVGEKEINGKSFLIIYLKLKRRNIGRLGGFINIEEDRVFNYEILIDKNLYLPVQIIQTNNIDSSKMTSSFQNIQINKDLLLEESWNYDHFLDEFEIINQSQMNTEKLDSTLFKLKPFKIP